MESALHCGIERKEVFFRLSAVRFYAISIEIYHALTCVYMLLIKGNLSAVACSPFLALCLYKRLFYKANVKDGLSVSINAAVGHFRYHKVTDRAELYLIVYLSLGVCAYKYLKYVAH